MKFADLWPRRIRVEDGLPAAASEFRSRLEFTTIPWTIALQNFTMARGQGRVQMVGANGGSHLAAGTTGLDDGKRETMSGNGVIDGYFACLSDHLPDRRYNELFEELWW